LCLPFFRCKNRTMEIVKFEDVSKPEVFAALAQQVQQHIVANKLVTEFRDKRGNRNLYPLVEAWQFAGALLGLFPRLVSLENQGNDATGLYKYRAEIDIIESQSGKVICKGIAICSNQEKSKQYFDEYAIASMAQTRATGKAFRLCLGWIMKAAGFESTPAEDMEWQEPGSKPQFDPAILKEYQAFAVSAINGAKDAVTVKELAWGAKALKEVPEFVDAVRSAYKKLLPDG
jgi:hypothetical protein